MHRDRVSPASRLPASGAASPQVVPVLVCQCAMADAPVRYGRCIEIGLTYIAFADISGGFAVHSSARVHWKSGCRASSIVIGNPARRQPLFQQLLQRRSNFRLPFLWNVLDQRLHRALDQHSQDCVGVSTARASHIDRLSEDAGWIGSASSNTFGTPDQVIDCGKRTVRHGARLADRPATRQAPACCPFAGCPLVISLVSASLVVSRHPLARRLPHAIRQPASNAIQRSRTPDRSSRSHLQERGMGSGPFPKRRALLSCCRSVVDVRQPQLRPAEPNGTTAISADCHADAARCTIFDSTQVHAGETASYSV